MVSPDFFYLSVASVSAVLLGICVTLRNNAYSTILDHVDKEIRLGDKDYEAVLLRSAWASMLSGLAFTGAIGTAFGGVFQGQSSSLGGNWFKATGLLFAAGLIAMIFSLFSGHFKNPLQIPFRKPSVVSRDNRPEITRQDVRSKSEDKQDTARGSTSKQQQKE